MIRVLIVSRDKDSFTELETFLDENHVDISWGTSGGSVLGTISDKPYDLVIADEDLPDMTGLEFALKLVKTSPLTHCTIVSSLSEEEYHDKSEGLGLLMQLPVNPGREQGEELYEQLKKLLILSSRM